MRPGRGDPAGRCVMQAIEEGRARERDVVAEIDIADGLDTLTIVSGRALRTHGEPDAIAEVGSVRGLLELEFGECEVRRCEAELADLIVGEAAGELEGVEEGHDKTHSAMVAFP